MSNLEEVLASLSRGEMTVKQARDRLRNPAELPAPGAVLDLERAARTGIPEVVYGAGKSAEQIAQLLDKLHQHGQPVLATRVGAEKAAAVLEQMPELNYEPVARLLIGGPMVAPRLGRVAVCCAGTSDLPVAKEAAITARWLGCLVEEYTDIGVAGLHRLLSRLEAIRTAQIVIVVAGMEGALGAVLTGLVSAPVIAVPTSVGYGVHLGGLTALFGMLDACASGLTVVNIDNGFGAAIAARRMLAGQP